MRLLRTSRTTFASKEPPSSLFKRPLRLTSCPSSKIPTSAPSTPSESPSCPRTSSSLDASVESDPKSRHLSNPPREETRGVQIRLFPSNPVGKPPPILSYTARFISPKGKFCYSEVGTIDYFSEIDFSVRRNWFISDILRLPSSFQLHGERSGQSKTQR